MKKHHMTKTKRNGVTIDINGKTYTLVLDVNALCVLENVMSTEKKEATYAQVLAMAERGQLVALRAVVWAALRQHHKEVTLEDVGKLIEEIGVGELDAKLKQATELAVAPPPSVDSPRKRTIGTA